MSKLSRKNLKKREISTPHLTAKTLNQTACFCILFPLKPKANEKVLTVNVRELLCYRVSLKKKYIICNSNCSSEESWGRNWDFLIEIWICNEHAEAIIRKWESGRGGASLLEDTVFTFSF